eukprot:277144-Lingulodinium_polyedra.AAC.1
MQMTEHYWEERRGDAVNQDSKLPAEEQQAFLGGARSACMVCPELLDTVSKEVERVSSIRKNARKLREEQAATRGKAPGAKQ